MASLIGWRFLGVDNFFGDTSNEVLFKPKVSNFVLIMLVKQVNEVISDVIELVFLGGNLLALVRLGNPLRVGTVAWLAGKAADGVVIEV